MSSSRHRRLRTKPLLNYARPRPPPIASTIPTSCLPSRILRQPVPNLPEPKPNFATQRSMPRRRGPCCPSTCGPASAAPEGTLLTLADLSHMEAEVEVYEEAVPRLSVGQPVRLESPVLQVPLSGAIRRIGLEVGRQSLTSSDPAANTDARVVKAWVDIDEASAVQAARFVGLEVIAHIDVEEEVP